MHNVIQRLKKETKDSLILENELMMRHTSFKIGGCADIFIDVSINDFPAIIDICKEESIPITVIGNGSNLLVGDKGIRGVTVSFGERASFFEIEDEIISSEAGCLLSVLSKEAQKASLSGLEFAGGIPGSLGGAVFMNAGAYDGEMKNIILSVDYYDSLNRQIKTVSNEECGFSYRHSAFSDAESYVLRAKMKLSLKDKESISLKMREYSEARREKQPLELPSAGSTFKRPEGYFAGKLISDCGLKGFSIGAARVSEKHAGFVVNMGGATATQVRELIDTVSERVYQSTGVELSPEVRFVGEF